MTLIDSFAFEPSSDGSGLVSAGLCTPDVASAPVSLLRDRQFFSPATRRSLHDFIVNQPPRSRQNGLGVACFPTRDSLADDKPDTPNDQNTRLVLLHASFSQVVVGPMNMQA
ncbi:hypothetical protein [Brucella pituitosa]|uniref:hypothetical protein n=1 Tax=Brucella pituitosa TaxID=571256 RepID=UPI000FE26C1C|nr:hypothetical protein [Brucella pituitosa]